MPKVSVVIPAYNAIKYLPETVERVLKQTFTDFEVLIINDGSSDNIVAWTSGILDPRVKLISQQNQGVSVARNTGIAQAQGEYIAFLDADDLWEPTKLEKQVHCLEHNQSIGLVHTWMAVIDQQSKPTGRVMTSNAEGEVWKQLVEKNTVACSSVMLRRCCFETVGVFLPRDECPVDVEDWEMWIRVASCYAFAVIKEPLMLYRQHPNNTSKNWQSIEQAYRIVIERAFNSVPSELLYLKNRSYGHANLRLAWKCLQSIDRDYKKAIHFRQQAIINYPQLRYSGESIRLLVAIALRQGLGAKNYPKMLAIINTLRRRISRVARLCSIY
jgi:glycosyltransferase involved in cell wall biosynthesis